MVKTLGLIPLASLVVVAAASAAPAGPVYVQYSELWQGCGRPLVTDLRGPIRFAVDKTSLRYPNVQFELVDVDPPGSKLNPTASLVLHELDLMRGRDICIAGVLYDLGNRYRLVPLRLKRKPL